MDRQLQGSPVVHIVSQIRTTSNDNLTPCNIAIVAFGPSRLLLLGLYSRFFEYHCQPGIRPLLASVHTSHSVREPCHTDLIGCSSSWLGVFVLRSRWKTGELLGWSSNAGRSIEGVSRGNGQGVVGLMTRIMHILG